MIGFANVSGILQYLGKVDLSSAVALMKIEGRSLFIKNKCATLQNFRDSSVG